MKAEMKPFSPDGQPETVEKCHLYGIGHCDDGGAVFPGQRLCLNHLTLWEIYLDKNFYDFVTSRMTAPWHTFEKVSAECLDDFREEFVEFVKRSAGNEER